MAVLPTLTSHQNRVLRLSFFSLGSLLILYVLFSLTSSSTTPDATVPSHPSTSWSGSSTPLGFPATPYPVWGKGEDGLLATDQGGINYNAETGEYRWSEDYPWTKGKQHSRIMVASHFTAHEGTYPSEAKGQERQGRKERRERELNTSRRRRDPELLSQRSASDRRPLPRKPPHGIFADLALLPPDFALALRDLLHYYLSAVSRSQTLKSCPDASSLLSPYQTFTCRSSTLYRPSFPRQRTSESTPPPSAGASRTSSSRSGSTRRRPTMTQRLSQTISRRTTSSQRSGRTTGRRRTWLCSGRVRSS